MATMKTEVLAQRGAEHGFTLRQRAAAPRARGLAAGVARSRPRQRRRRAPAPPAALAEATAGIDRRRRLPRVAAHAAPLVRGAAAGRGTSRGRAVRRIPGRRTSAPTSARPRSPCSHARAPAWSFRDVACCGRPMLSEGLVDAGAPQRPRQPRRARAAGRAGRAASRGWSRAASSRFATTTRRCSPTTRASRPWPARRGCGRRRCSSSTRGRGSVRAPASACCCTATATRRRWWARGRRRPRWRWCPGVEVETLDSGCCGMAGLVRLRARALRRVDADGGASPVRRRARRARRDGGGARDLAAASRSPTAPGGTPCTRRSSWPRGWRDDVAMTSDDTLGICIAGATGWTGKALVQGVLEAPDLRLASAVARSTAGRDVGEALGREPLGVPVRRPWPRRSTAST